MADKPTTTPLKTTWEFTKESYANLRRPEYDPVGDQLDNITKSLKFLMKSGVKIGEFGEAQVKMSQTVKDKYPKPI